LLGQEWAVSSALCAGGFAAGKAVFMDAGSTVLVFKAVDCGMAKLEGLDFSATDSLGLP